MLDDSSSSDKESSDDDDEDSSDFEGLIFINNKEANNKAKKIPPRVKGELLPAGNDQSMSERLKWLRIEIQRFGETHQLMTIDKYYMQK